LCRTFALFGKEGTEQIHQRIVQQAKEAAIITGNKLRTDTTAVELTYPKFRSQSQTKEPVRKAA
jgi:hypothetical protein